MTLDEAITLLKFNNKHIADLKNDDLQQLAEWLEELKSYRAQVFSEEMTKVMLNEERNKAIDDFSNALADDLTWLMKFGDEVYIDVGNDVRIRAEQLKDGDGE